MRVMKCGVAVALLLFGFGAASVRSQTAYPYPVPDDIPRGTGLDIRLTDTSNSALVPMPKLEKDSYDWYQRHREVLALKKADPEVVLIGDSITHFWDGLPKAARASGPKSWAEAFGKMRVINEGFGYDRIQNVLWRLEHDELRGLHPKWVVINIGTNNFGGSSHARMNTPEEVAAGVVAVVNEVRSETPESEVIVMGIFPRGRNPTDSWRPRITQANSILARELKGRVKVQFLDIGDRFLEPDGTLPGTMMFDGTHPTELGYRQWAQALIDAGVRGKGTPRGMSGGTAVGSTRSMLPPHWST